MVVAAPAIAWIVSAGLGWSLAVADDLAVTQPPSSEELEVLRDLLATQKRPPGS